MLRDVFRRHQMQPLFLENGFSADLVTAHFYA